MMFAEDSEDEDARIEQYKSFARSLLHPSSPWDLCKAVDDALDRDFIEGVVFNNLDPADTNICTKTVIDSSTQGFSAKVQISEAVTVLQLVQDVFARDQELAEYFEESKMFCTCEVFNKQWSELDLDIEEIEWDIEPKRVWRDTEAVVVSIEAVPNVGPYFTPERQQAVRKLAASLPPNIPVMYTGATLPLNPPEPSSLFQPAVCTNARGSGSDPVTFEVCHESSDPGATITLRLETTANIEQHLNLRMTAHASQSDSTLKSMRYGARLLGHNYSVDQWQWDKGIAAAVHIQLTSTRPAWFSEGNTRMQTEVRADSHDKKVLDCTPAGGTNARTDWAFLDIGSVVTWDYAPPASITVQMAVECQLIRRMMQLVRSRLTVIQEMTARLPATSIMNKLRLDTTGKGIRILNRKGLVAAEHGTSAEAGRGWKTLVFDEDTPALTAMAFMPTSAPLRDLW